jgi:cytochrome P450
MLLNEVLPLLLAYWPIVLLVFLGIYLVRNYTYNGLQKYPAPGLAAYSNWYRYFENFSRNTHNRHIEWHRKHGNVVRLGPNVLSFADPKAIKIIYGLNKGMTKSDFYPVQQATAKGRRLESLFSTKNEGYHAKYRRCVNNAFAMSSLVNYEPLVDSTTDAFIEQTEKRYCDTGKTCNFSKWLQFFAFDVIGEITWSKRIGFVDRDHDVDGIVKFIGDFLAYAAPVGQMPFLDLVWLKNPVLMQLRRWGINNSVFPVTKFAVDRNKERFGEMEKIKQDGKLDEESGKGVDLLMKFTQAQHDHPEFMTDAQVLASCASMIFAGSETTAISLSAVFHNLLKDRRVYDKLMRELDEAVRSGTISDRENKKVSWAEAQKLPYLDAVIQESLRVHPAAGLILERVTPPQGIDILGHFVPGNTIVGCNAWVIHRRPEVFGEDADTFRPERWLEASPEQLKEMKVSTTRQSNSVNFANVFKATWFVFGAGSRTCLGKNISLLELYKLVPTFLRNFEIDTRDESKYEHYCAWFVRQLNFNTVFKRREISR